MRDGGRLQAAIEVLSDIEARKRPVTDALKDWGLNHRFAGSGDRAAIGNLVHDALRRRASMGAAIGDVSPRAVVLATYALVWGKGIEGLVAALNDPHAPEALDDGERKRLRTAMAGPQTGAALSDQAASADIPEWLYPLFQRVFGDDVIAEGRALAARAPVDLRVNTLKTDRESVLPAFTPLGATATPLSPHGIRIPIGTGASRSPHVESDPEFLKGQIEIQDEGSQLAALVAGVRPGEQVLDLCAGAGGKTLALAAEMENRGQIHAFDNDKRRMRDLFERSTRAGLRNLKILTPGRGDPLADLEGEMNVVLIDAPCTGTGTWRRRPDAKWRLSMKALDTRMAEQDAVLEAGLKCLKPKGRLVYITCSVLAEENEDRVSRLLLTHPDLRVADPLARLAPDLAARLKPFVRSDIARFPTLRLTPASAGTDGFFVAVIERG